jgi:ribosome-binding factor A
MKRPVTSGRQAPRGPSQRQLRAGELIRHALVDILREQEITDPDIAGVSITLTEVRMSPDLRHATVFVEPLGGGEQAAVVVKALNRHHKFLRGRLGHAIDMKFTPALKFLHDDTFDEAARMSRLFADPRVAQDLTPGEPPPSPDGREILDDTKEPSQGLGDSWKDQD